MTPFQEKRLTLRHSNAFQMKVAEEIEKGRLRIITFLRKLVYILVQNFISGHHIANSNRAVHQFCCVFVVCRLIKMLFEYLIVCLICPAEPDKGYLVNLCYLRIFP